MDLSATFSTVRKSPYWHVVKSFLWIGIFGTVSWFCIGTYVWAEADGGNSALWSNKFFIPRTNFILVFIFSFITLLWQRVIKVKLLLPLFLTIGIIAFTIFSSLQNAEEMRKLEILGRYQPFREAINSQNWEEAYTFMSPDYRKDHTVEKFQEEILFLIHLINDSNHLEEITIYAIHPFDEMAWIAPYDDISKDYHRRFGTGLNLIRIEGQWYFEEYPNFFID